MTRPGLRRLKESSGSEVVAMHLTSPSSPPTSNARCLGRQLRLRRPNKNSSHRTFTFGSRSHAQSLPSFPTNPVASLTHATGCFGHCRYPDINWFQQGTLVPLPTNAALRTTFLPQFGENAMIDAVVIQPGVDAGEPSGSAQASSTAGASFLHCRLNRSTRA